MTNRFFGSVGALAMLIACGVLSPVAVEGQTPTAKPRAAAAGRTPDGQPDISGAWLPLGPELAETPSGERWRAPQGGNNANFNFGSTALEYKRPTDEKPMVVDPPDGRIPMQPWAQVKRDEIISNQDKVEFLDPRVRCLQSGVPRANMPVPGNSYLFVQIPGYVVMFYEWNHLYRMIPLDGRPHVSPSVRLAMGDPRGHWEGNTLVVDVTNFTDKTWVTGLRSPPEGAPASGIWTGHGVFNSEALHVVERFTIADADSIDYEATIDDPKVFTRPWKIAYKAFKKAPKNHELFEYACFEGSQRNIFLLTGVNIEK